jgi:flagellar protein FliS
MNQYVKQYQKASIETASREQILIMLYDGAIQFLNKAKVAMEAKDFEAIHNNLVGAQNIIQEFINSMDREVAPQLAENLISLYEYFLRRLVQANMKRQVEPIDEETNNILIIEKNTKNVVQKISADELSNYVSFLSNSQGSMVNRKF